MGRVDPRRCRTLTPFPIGNGPIVYWMSRDQRTQDNWALLHAQDLALSQGRPLVVLFSLSPAFLGATLRHYAFMIKGLEETAPTLQRLGIPFCVELGDPAQTVLHFLARLSAGALVSDFDPLSIKRSWKETLNSHLSIPHIEVDAHNVVPCWIASSKAEFGAYTLRPKIQRLLTEFLTDFPPLLPHPYPWEGTPSLPTWDLLAPKLSVDQTVGESTHVRPGSQAGQTRLQEFLSTDFHLYATQRNDPTKDAQSLLSGYLHFGQLSAQRVALTVENLPHSDSKVSFLEELIIRKELSDNYCYYNKNYASFEGFPSWAKDTLNAHRFDPREYVYSESQFEQCLTHDPLWNAAQKQVVTTGFMAGYMRMYWAKKILEWTSSPEEAQRIAIGLNDRYQLDGRDPNGYAGIAWSIGGVHDRAWFERPVYGKIRYMNANGCHSKFDVQAYLRKCLTIL